MSIYKRPLVLTILDGWNYRTETANNTIAVARKPTTTNCCASNPTR
ncbi:MAG: hypothetical protein ABSC48_18770 [Terracidiphilus sp.]